MTNTDPPDKSAFASLDDLPTRIKQPPWRWWRQPISIILLGGMCIVVGLTVFINRPQTILQSAVVLRADLNADTPQQTALIQFQGMHIVMRDLVIDRDLPDLKAGATACLVVQSRQYGGATRYVLRPRDEC